MSEIIYTTISKSIVIDSLKAAESAAKSAKSLDKAECTIWNAACSAAYHCTTLQGMSKEAVKEEVKQGIIAALTEALPSELPETFTDLNGKEQSLCKKDGSIKWSSWPVTKRHMAYSSDIAKVILNGLGEALMPSPDQVATRLSILSLCKGTESVLDSISRTTKSLQGFLDKVEGSSEVYQAAAEVDTLRVNGLAPVDQIKGLVRKIDALLASCDAKDRAAVLTEMESLLIHFEE